MADIPFDPFKESTPALQHFLGRAVVTSRMSSEGERISFTTMFTSFLVADDPVSRWFQTYVRQAEIAVSEILARKKLAEPGLLEKAAQTAISDDLLHKPPPLTFSANNMLKQALELCNTINNTLSEPTLLDVAHLMGAYIYHPGAHISQLNSWKFDAPAWSNAFLSFMQNQAPTQLNAWANIHQDTFKQPPVIHAETKPLLPLNRLQEFNLSETVQKIIEAGIEMIHTRGVEPNALTTSILLFAISNFPLPDLFNRSDKDLADTAHLIDAWLNPQKLSSVQDNYFARGSANPPPATHQAVQTNQPVEQVQETQQTADTPAETATTMITQNVYDTFNYACDLTLNTVGHRQPVVRHLLAGLLCFGADSQPLGARRRLEELGADIHTLRTDFFKFVQQNYPHDNLRVWEYILSTPALEAEDRLLQYDADNATGEDLLGIENDVNALATLIAAKTTIPPLSVGIFGNWGAGKTFFMRQLMRQVNKISRRARKSDQPQNKISFYRYIVQIEFNAWHYVEGNLWASLVEHILSNLRIADEDQPDIMQARQEHLLDQLEIETLALDQASKEEERIQTVVNEADAEIKEIVKNLEREQQELTAAQLSPVEILQTIQLDDTVKAQISQLMKSTGLSETVESAQEFFDALHKMQSVLEQGNSILVPLARAEDKRRRLIILIAILIASFLVGLLVSWLTTAWGDTLSRYSGLATWVATLFSSGAVWLRNQANWVSTHIEKAEEANQKIEKMLADKKAEYDRQIAEAQQKIDHLNAQYAAARRKKDEAERRVKEIETELAELSPAQQLGKFILDRTSSDDYRKHLGLLALIRRDFETLSKYIEAQNKIFENDHQTTDAESKGVCINRIILYIDDLDRCPPNKVVQVLQAVHLLLAFPLFVVVVGVDARWVSQSLSSNYRELLQGDEPYESSSMGREATPHDYLEKIFQIPLWIEPVGERGSKNMLRKLLQSSLVHEANGSTTGDHKTTSTEQETGTVEPGAEAAEPTPVEQDQSAGATDDHATAQEDVEQQVDQDKGQPATDAHHLDPDELNRFLNPISLTVHEKELEFMEQLAPLLGRSPRAVKRFVNVYRLVKTSLDDVEQALFLTKREPLDDYQVVMFLLSILTGMPSLSRQIFEGVTNDRRQDEGQVEETGEEDNNLAGLLADLQGQYQSSTARKDLERLEQWVNNHNAGQWKSVPLEAFAVWTSQVGRYSFRVGQP